MRWLRSVGIGLLVACAAVSCLRKPLGEEVNTPGLEQQNPLEPQPAPAKPGVNVPAVKVNTVGYPPAWTKIASFNVRPDSAVIKNAAGAIVHKVAAEDVREIGADRASGDPVWHSANLVLVGTEMVAQMRPPQPEAQPKAEPQPNP